MDNLNNVTDKISKLFITVGIVGLLISIIDIVYIIFPLYISNPDWIFKTTQSLINSLLAPALCIVLLLAGIYFKKNYTSKKTTLIVEKLVSILAFAFGLLICINLLFYSLSIKTYQTTIVSSVKTQSEDVLKQFEQIYKGQKFQISEKLYKQKVEEVHQKTAAQIAQTKKVLLFKSIKIIIESVLYIFLFFAVSIFSFSSAKHNLLKLKFSK